MPNEQVLEEVIKEELVLASGSPRRARILRAVGWPFEMMAANVDESRFESDLAIEIVLAQERKSVQRPRQPGHGLGVGAIETQGFL